MIHFAASFCMCVLSDSFAMTFSMEEQHRAEYHYWSYQKVDLVIVRIPIRSSRIWKGR